MIAEKAELMQYALECGEPEAISRHDKTQLAVKAIIGKLIKDQASNKHDLLEIGAYTGWQTLVYRNQLKRPGRTLIYDWQDFRSEKVKKLIELKLVNLERDVFSDSDETFDVIVCNQVVEHLKNIFTPLSEILRVLRLGGFLILSVPNLSALHNCALLSFGYQPTCITIGSSHVRGFSIWSMSKFLDMTDNLKIIKMVGVGLHPFTSARLPWPLVTYCHTPIWLLKKVSSSYPNWVDIRQKDFTTTKFFE